MATFDVTQAYIDVQLPQVTLTILTYLLIIAEKNVLIKHLKHFENVLTCSSPEGY